MGAILAGSQAAKETLVLQSDEIKDAETTCYSSRQEVIQQQSVFKHQCVDGSQLGCLKWALQV